VGSKNTDSNYAVNSRSRVGFEGEQTVGVQAL